MLYEIRQKAIAAKLITIAAMLALSLGVIFIGAGQAYADPEPTAVMISDVKLSDFDEPEIGGTPVPSGHLAVYFSNNVIYINSKPDEVHKPSPMIDEDLKPSWSEAGVAMKEGETFSAGHTYSVTVQVMRQIDTAHHPDGVNIGNAKSYINNVQKGTPTTSNQNGGYWFIGMTAEWTLYGITFDPNEGTGTAKTQTAYDKTTTLSKNDEYTKFTREGYTLAGWSTTKDGKVEYADGANFTFPEGSVETTLYAQWVPVTYKVIVTADPAEGGTASADKQEAAKGDTVTLSVSPKDGYEFVEWVPVTEGVTIKDGKFTMPASDVEVKATFKEKPQPKPQPITVTHTVTFDANGGTGAMDPLTGEEGTEVALTANKFARTGYTFKGWNTKADGTGTAYADKATVKLDADITLYAQWTKNASSSSSTKATNSTKSSSSNTLAKTGDFTPFAIGGVALIALLAAGALVLARFRRHE